MSKVSGIQKPKTFINEDGEEVEEEVIPIIQVDDNLNNMFYPKFKDKMKKADKEANKAEGFKLNAKAIQDFQDIIYQAVGQSIGYEDGQRMYEHANI